MADAGAEALTAAGQGTHEPVPAQSARVAGERFQRVAEEQAALRRIAMQVARAGPPEEVFAAVTDEVHRLLGNDFTTMSRFNTDSTLTIVGVRVSPGTPSHVAIGHRASLGGRNVHTLVFRTGRPVRIDDLDEDAASAPGPPADPGRDPAVKAVAALRAVGVRSAAGVPISVEGRLWGAMAVAAAHGQQLPADTEERLAGFTELVATAIANAEAREELRRVADEQAALRRVATLVARGGSPAAVFTAVAAEVADLYHADTSSVVRFEPDGQATLMGGHGWGPGSEPGTRGDLPAGTPAAVSLRSGGTARYDADDPVSGDVPAMADLGYKSAVNVPIVVEGRLWGVVGVGSRRERLPQDTGQRLAGFTELVAAAISNAEAQAELTASRARIVATADQTRRRFERDLHDSAQQSLVSLGLHVRAARANPPEGDELARWLDQMAAGLAGVLEEVREIAHGLHPAVLATGGLRPALHALARRSAVPVRLHIRLEGRLPEPVEIAAYYVVSEALTNVAKHAGASFADVRVTAADGVLRVRVLDDGRGGAGFTGGSGLVGLKDRVEALGGRIWLRSPPGNGTAVEIELLL